MAKLQKDLIAQLWTSFRVAVIHRDAPKAQIIEMRRAFYAGAQGLLNAITSASLLDPGVEETEADLRQMEAIADELGEFALAVARGEA